MPTYKVERTARGIRADYVSGVSNYPRGFQHLAPPDFQWLRVFEVYPPFAAPLLIVHFPDGGRLWILNAASPIAARKTRLFCPLARNFGKDGPIEDVHKFNLLIFNEDKVIVKSQRPEDLPLDAQMEAHIAADRTSIAYRRLLKEMGLGLALCRMVNSRSQALVFQALVAPAGPVRGANHFRLMGWRTATE